MNGFISIKLENDRIFREGSFPDMRSETITDIPDVPEVRRAGVFRTAGNIAAMTTIGAVLSEAGRKVIALNFANAMYPGGGYVLGGNAQEESLCRASMLFYTIREQKAYYRRNRFHVLPDYTDTIIWSENVPVIRDDSGKLLEKPVKYDVITVPAVNRRFAKFMFSRRKISRTMSVRIEKIIKFAVSKKPDVLVLGAFGCGMFGNSREDVFQMFDEHINRYVPDDIKIVFAIP